MAVEKVKRKISLSLLVRAFVLALVIFGIGWWVGSQVNQQVYQSLSFELTTLRDSGVNLDVIGLVASDVQNSSDLLERRRLCAAAEEASHAVGVVTADVGRRLDLLDKKKPDDADTKSLKRQYFSLEARDYLTWKKLKQVCSSNVTTVLFFYAPEITCPSCDGQLQEISRLKQTNPGGILVYTFDLSYANAVPSIKMLATIYGVKQAPAVVISEREVGVPASFDKMLALVNK